MPRTPAAPYARSPQSPDMVTVTQQDEDERRARRLEDKNRKRFRAIEEKIDDMYEMLLERADSNSDVAKTQKTPDQIVKDAK